MSVHLLVEIWADDLMQPDLEGSDWPKFYKNYIGSLPIVLNGVLVEGGGGGGRRDWEVEQKVVSCRAKIKRRLQATSPV